MGGKVYTFGISGLLYKSNVLLYDRETESLWSQLKREAVTGPMTGARLTPLSSTLSTWKRWKRLHPDTLVLSTDTGYSRDYSADPYEGYFKSPLAFLGFRGKTSTELPEKELVLGIEMEGVKKAYPFSVLREMKAPFDDSISGHNITIHFDRESEEAYATEKERRLPGTVSYWFVWYSFHHDTPIYREKR
ncbi:MAG: DUF3179 domain-containing protein [Deltaproteobacteria bacterium]|nr:DUF3179 domain-containing protein [Deltaproteobacteria bacterium]